MPVSRSLRTRSFGADGSGLSRGWTMRRPSSHLDLPVASSPETSGGGAFFAVSGLDSLPLALFSGLASLPEKATTRRMTSTTAPPAPPRIRGRLFFWGPAGAALPRRVGAGDLGPGFAGDGFPAPGFLGGSGIVRSKFSESPWKRKGPSRDSRRPL